MSPLIRIALAINLFCSSPTFKIVIKYSSLLHTHLMLILNFLFQHLFYPLLNKKLKQGSNSDKHQIISVCHYVSSPSGSHDEDVDCAVCLCKLRERDEMRLLACEHVFHRDCLDTWIRFKFNNTTCPLCRVSVGPITTQIKELHVASQPFDCSPVEQEIQFLR